MKEAKTLDEKIRREDLTIAVSEFEKVMENAIYRTPHTIMAGMSRNHSIKTMIEYLNNIQKKHIVQSNYKITYKKT